MMSFQFGYKNVFMGFASTDTKCFTSIENADRSVITSGGSKGGREGRAPPLGSKFFQFHAVFGKFWQNRMLAPPGELAPPPRGNPGSATDNCLLSKT